MAEYTPMEETPRSLAQQDHVSSVDRDDLLLKLSYLWFPKTMHLVNNFFSHNLHYGGQQAGQADYLIKLNIHLGLS